MITNLGILKVEPKGERQIVMTRGFNAPRKFVYDALTKPELVKRWLLPPGWSLPVCEIDLRVGGAYKYVWKQDKGGAELAVSGIYKELNPPERIVHTEVFVPVWYPGENIITTVLTEEASKTSFTATMLYVSHEAREQVLKSGMESGLVPSYKQLDAVLATLIAG